MSSTNRPFRSQFTKIEKEYCMRITNKLIDHDLTISFRQPVNPEAENCPNYFQIVKHPMDLGTLKKN